MRKKIFLFSMLFAFCLYFVNAQIIMDPATIDQGALPSGMSVVEINGTPYLQVITNGWNSILDVNYVLASDQTISCDVKYAHGDPAYTLAQTSNCGVNINDTINKVPNPWGEGMVASQTSLGINPANAGDFASLSKTVDSHMGLIHQIQFFAQQNVNWGATVGDTLWVGKIKVVTESPYVLMRPAELDPTALPSGMSLVTIGDNVYLQVITNGWNSILDVDGFELLENLEVSCDVKYAHGSTASTLAQTTNCGVNLNDTVNKVPNPWGEGMVASQTSIGINPANASDFASLTKVVDGNMKLVHQIQIFAQENVTWGGTIGDTLWVGDITFKDHYTEIITGGNMEDASAWTAYSRADNADTAAFEFNYTADGPTEGKGGCLKITTFGSSGGFVMQEVTVTPGHNYSLSGAFKNISDSISNSWVELIVTNVKPVINAEFSANDAWAIYERNTWRTDPPQNDLDIDTTFEVFNHRDNDPKKFFVPDSVTQTTWYVLIKAGSSGNTGIVLEYLFDEISLLDLGEGTGLVTKIALAAESKTIEVGGTTQVTATVTPTYAEDLTVSYSSSDDAIATVSDAGVVTGVAVGTVTITVEANDASGVTATIDINVEAEEPPDGIEEMSASNFTIYPNPASDVLYIKDAESVINVQIVNIVGQVLQTVNPTNSNLIEINISSLTSGVYMIKVNEANETHIQRIVIK